MELLAVKTEYAILRSDPQESGAVLEQAPDHEVGQPLLAAVVIKAVLLGAEDRDQREGGEEHLEDGNARTAFPSAGRPGRWSAVKQALQHNSPRP